jgi:hypothetical protein
MAGLASSEALFWHGSWNATIHDATILIRDCSHPAPGILYQRILAVRLPHIQVKFRGC